MKPSDMSKILDGISKLNKMDEADVAKVILDSDKNDESAEKVSVNKE